jgi:ubiquinol-cytochrome c reductase cytochrome b subunit
MIRRLVLWLEQRTGIPAAISGFLSEEIPASSGWAQVFGSVVLFLFLIQAFTGILLALNFAPTPGEAYSSLNYILNEVAGGRMIRGLHHWGASMLIVVVVLHMIQVFLYGAYRKPREATWMVGIVLLLVTLAFGLTGYLLPWDNRAYWGTVVTTQMAGQAPVLGAYVQRLMGTESGVGVVTFARFYALHTVVLPVLALVLVAFHVSLVRRHGVAPAPSDDRPKKRFFPAQAFKDTCAVFAAFAILFVLAAVARAPLERLADPTDSMYVPRPDWYFLFLFQSLKLFKGISEQIGSVLLPTLAVLLLLALPFLDRARLRRVTERTVAIGVVVLCVAGWTALTAAAVLTTPRSAGQEASAAPWARLAPPEVAGFGYFRQAGCTSCHNLVDGQPKAGPNLAELDTNAVTGEALAHFTNESRLNSAQLDAIASFLRRLNPDNAARFSAVPPGFAAGAQVLVSSGCLSCHAINGTGGVIGPPLNGLSQRRSREWVEQHLRDPKSQSPGTIMPPFPLPAQDRDRLISYLFSLPGK